MSIKESALMFIALGATFLIALAANAIGRRTRLPRVTLLIILGFLIGPEVFDLLPASRETMFSLAANIALTMVGFLLGEKLGHAGRPGFMPRQVLTISIVAVLVTAAVVFAGLALIGSGVAAAILLAGIATATAPASTIDVVQETKSKSPFSQLLLSIVALDDAWGLLLFSFALAGAEILLGQGSGAAASLATAGRELGGALVLGALLGVPMAYLTGRISKGEPTMLEAIGFVFLACGLALFWQVSFILTAMMMGALVSRLAQHHERPFHVIENIELPFMIVFFVLAGASLEVSALASVGALGIAYIGLRCVGRIAGGWLGGLLSNADRPTRRWIGLALMPQAGVALGMGLLAATRIPEVGVIILQVTIGSTVFFELVGPLLTRLALTREKNESQAQDPV
ncbi:MAG: cation:proton antiporter [Luteolibacter sp.]